MSVQRTHGPVVFIPSTSENDHKLSIIALTLHSSRVEIYAQYSKICQSYQDPNKQYAQMWKLGLLICVLSAMSESYFQQNKLTIIDLTRVTLNFAEHNDSKSLYIYICI